MRKTLLLFLAAGGLFAQRFHVGKPPAGEEEQSWDISIGPDGAGLPEGRGTVQDGLKVYESRCKKCHGANGTGGDEAPLVGGAGTLATPKPLKTVGSYWPHATTLFDYVRRAMPFKDPGSLNSNQVYAVTAYVLHLNGIIGDNQVMDAKTLPQVRMPNRDGFVQDPRSGAKKNKPAGKR